MAFEVWKYRDVTLYRGDCLEVLPTLAPGSVDAVVTDPPYCSGSVGEAQRTAAKGQGIRSENLRRFGWFTGDNMGTAGICWLLRMLASVARGCTKETGSLLFFCDWRMVSAIQPAIESSGVRYQGLVVWDKGHMGLGNGFRAQHELVLHFTLGSPEYYDLGTANVIRAARVNGDDREHQTQKPLDLMTRLVKVVSPPAGTVVDCFTGSGTTAEACIRTGRKFIGIEIDPGYFEIAKARVLRAYDSEALFDSLNLAKGETRP